MPAGDLSSIDFDYQNAVLTFKAKFYVVIK